MDGTVALAWGPDGAGPGPWIVLMPLLWFAVVAGLIAVRRRVGRVVGTRAGRPSFGAAADPSLSAREVLDRRYAEGAVGTSEYRERRTVMDEMDAQADSWVALAARTDAGKVI